MPLEDGERDRDWLTMRKAARRVDRDVRTIKRWHAAGLPMTVVDGTNFVARQPLLAWWRARLLADPCRQRARARRERLGIAA